MGNGKTQGSAARKATLEADEGQPLRFVSAASLFDGHDAVQVDAAREHWKTMKAGGNTVTYWQQTPDKRWERKA